MSGMDKDQVDAIRAELADRPENLEELTDLLLELRSELEQAKEDAHSAATGLALLEARLRKAGIAL